MNESAIVTVNSATILAHILTDKVCETSKISDHAIVNICLYNKVN